MSAIAYPTEEIVEDRAPVECHVELVDRVMRLLPDDGFAEPLPGLHLHRASTPTGLGYGSTYPSFCVIAQGSKEIRVGDRAYVYDPEHYLITTASLPFASRIVEASPDHPYISLLLDLDPVVVGSVMIETGSQAANGKAISTAIAVSELDATLLDPMIRLAQLLDSPADARFLGPLIMREIVYRLLSGEQGNRVRYLAAQIGSTNRVATAIERIRRKFDEPLHVEQLANELGMSASSFHQRFKDITSMSPLQFQKQIRLHEARRLMLGERVDASTAGSRVGYDDVSHFTRDYKRIFGEPPHRDIKRLRDQAMESNDFTPLRK